MPANKLRRTGNLRITAGLRSLAAAERACRITMERQNNRPQRAPIAMHSQLNSSEFVFPDSSAQTQRAMVLGSEHLASGTIGIWQNKAHWRC